jgi:predicted metal-dependent phosphoesterase TrpH
LSIERVDLHTHSLHSDGVLAPRALIARAAMRGVGLLALTDHDTWSGCEEAAAACAEHSMRFVAGIELSASWRGQAVHVIGLQLDPRDASLATHVAGVIAQRRVRIREIGERLRRRGRIAGDEMAQSVLTQNSVPTRQHLARELVRGGHAKDINDAFERWLGRERPGHVPVEWPGLETTLAHLQANGACAVLAHAHRYRLSSGMLRRLVAEFAALGGAALEVSLPGMSPAEAGRIAQLARAHRLAGSAGSDFHDPAVPWNPLGRWLKLPDRIEPLAERFCGGHWDGGAPGANHVGL